MNNDEFHLISEVSLAGLPYNSEIIFRDGKSYRKEFSPEDLEWRELGDGWNSRTYKASARLASEYSEAQIWPHDHKNPQHKFVTGDRLDHIEAESKRLSEQAVQMLEVATTQDELLKAKVYVERARGMLATLRMIRGYHEGN